MVEAVALRKSGLGSIRVQHRATYLGLTLLRPIRAPTESARICHHFQPSRKRVTGWLATILLELIIFGKGQH